MTPCDYSGRPRDYVKRAYAHQAELSNHTSFYAQFFPSYTYNILGLFETNIGIKVFSNPFSLDLFLGTPLQPSSKFTYLKPVFTRIKTRMLYGIG